MGLFLLLSSFTAQAQDQSLDIEQFRPASDHYGYYQTHSADTLGHLQVGVGIWGNYANDPLVLRGPDGERVGLLSDGTGGPIESRFTGNAQLGMGITNFASISADLPIVLWQQGYDISSLNTNSQPPAIQASGLGDLRVVPKIAPLSRAQQPLGMALVVPVTIPTGGSEGFLGEGSVTATPTLALEFSDAGIWSRSYTWRTAVNLGYLVRQGDRARDVQVPNAMVYSAAVGFRPSEPIELILDVHGQRYGTSLAQNPLELNLGIKALIGQWISLNAGFGVGIIPGLGTPDYRGILGLTVAPSFDPDARDSDKDSVPDGMDRCPKHAEDLDGWQDQDGCPESDNDSDGIEDMVDRCPDDPEDDDGFMDNDGCPEDDNDKDEIPDTQDRCPDDAETVNGFEDEDGCPDNDPDMDTDGDGFSDGLDRCPYDAEDVDGFEDNDGCPDQDNDRDGIFDMEDACPDVRETFNGNQDEDGCPDEGRVELTAAKIEIYERVYFETGKATIKQESYGLLNEVAAVMKGNPQLLLIRIEGHTDSDGNELSNLKLSQARAEAVRSYLVKQGVSADRLVAVGFGEGMALESNDTAAGKANNRRVEFLIAKQE